MSFQRYEAYKDSGIGWLGEIPTHWRRTALKRLGKYENGFPFKPTDWSNEGTPIIRIAQLTSTAEPNRFNGVLDDLLEISTGDLLFSWSATIDSFIWQKGPAYLNQHIFKVTPTSDVAKRYLFYLIKHVAPKLADFDAHGSTMRHIKKESLSEIVGLPPTSEQAIISSFLDRELAKIDALIDEERRLIALLQERRQAVISHAVTKGLDPSVPMKDSGVEWLGKVPAHWRISQTKREIRFQTGWTPPSDNATYYGGRIPWATISDLTSRTVKETNATITPQAAELSQLRVVPSGSLLFSFKLSIGQVAFNGCPMYTNEAIAAFQPSRSVCLLFAYFAFPLFLTMNASENIYGAKLLNQELIRNALLLIPPIEEQNLIASFLDHETAKTGALIQEQAGLITLLQERRSALISAAVTGKIDLRNHALRQPIAPEELDDAA